MKTKREEVEEELKALAVMQNTVEEKAMAVWNNQQLKEKCRYFGTCSPKAANCPDKQKVERKFISNNNKNSNGDGCRFIGECCCCGEIGHYFSKCHNKTQKLMTKCSSVTSRLI